MEEIEYLDLVDENDNVTSAFSKMYKLIYDGELNYDKVGIKEIFYMDKEEIRELIKENPLQFKGDYPKFFKWLDENNML